jgi:hypothetical protein
MPGVRDPFIGVGSALRKARERRHVSLDEASRDTKLTPAHLRALEDEDFEALPGDPWIRGSLRTYARYLGLSADKVASAYARHAEEPEPPPPPGKLGGIERAIAATRIRDNQRLIVVVAASAIVVGGIFGVVSQRSDAPAPASLGSAPVAAAPPVDHPIEVALAARRDATVTITADAAPPRSYHLTPGETRSFQAIATIVVRIDPGGSVGLTVNGTDEGAPGSRGEPWQRTFSYGDVEGSTSPSPGSG